MTRPSISSLEPGDRVVWRGRRAAGELDGVAYFGHITRIDRHVFVVYDSGQSPVMPLSRTEVSRVLSR